jgi:signal transduction histidine kinase
MGPLRHPISGLRNLSISRKLTAITMATSSAALLLACAAFLLHDVVTLRRMLASEVTTLAQVVGANSSAAIVFRDAAAARENLAAFADEPNVQSAAIYTADGRLLTAWLRGGGPVGAATVPATAPALEPRFEHGVLVLARPVFLHGERVGTVLVKADLAEIRGRVARYLGIAVLVLAVSSLAAFLVSSRLQRVVSEPVLELAQIAHEVSENRDFSVRAVAHGTDELARLVEAFNEMLDQIERRDQALTRSLDRLRRAQESLVERTREVERVNRELARSNRELEDFASVASHDLQEPLRKITAFGDRLAGYAEALDEKGSDYLARMRAAAARMQTLIEDLLAYSRVTTRARPFAPVDLSAVVREVLGDLELRIEKSAADVEVGELPTVHADPLQMRQLFQNLLANALKFQRPGEAPAIRLSAEVFDGGGQGSDGGPAPALCRLTVEDNGIGFDEKYLDRLFKPFQRLHGQSAYEGTGIGLAICSKIAARHGGSITAASRPGQGARFVVTLPLTQTVVGEAA